MCLVLLSFQVHPESRVILAGNRDEFKNRLAEPPAKMNDSPAIFAGRDLQAGGTWMGRSSTGMMAALTNRRSQKPVPENPLTRGEIVMELLRQNTPEEASRWLSAQPIARYRPFNVLFGNTEQFFYFSSEEATDPVSLAPGNYALSNSFLDDRSWPKVDRSLQFLSEHSHLPLAEYLTELKQFLGDTTPPDELDSEGGGLEVHGVLGAVFIRNTGYGTVSSSIFTTAPGEEMYAFAEEVDLVRNPVTAYRLIPMEGVKS